MKRVFMIIMIVCLLLPLGAYASDQPKPIQVTIDGKTQTYQQVPQNIDGSVVVPLTSNLRITRG